MPNFNLDPNLFATDSIYIFSTLIQLVLAFIMATVLRKVYIKYGTSISNRAAFSVNFFLLAMTITFIISIVKSSLALSLGLVGALSIVRFRSAIKEPEELAYLFITIAIGIGLGADQIALTSTAFALVVCAIILTGHFRKEDLHGSNSNLSLTFRNISKIPDINQILNVIKPHCSKYVVRRYQKNEQLLDVGILLEFDAEDSIEKVRQGIEDIDASAEIQFVNPQSLAM